MVHPLAFKTWLLATTCFAAGSLPGLIACGQPTERSPVAAAASDAGGAFGSANAAPATDFPAPIVEPGAPADAPSLFGRASDSATGVAPCLTEPEPGTLYPKNWLRPRFAWSGGGSNLFELRLTAKNQTRDLVVYTTASAWTMPKPMWDGLRSHSADVPMTVSIRGGRYAGGALSQVSAPASGELGIAPVEAPGSIVFWAIRGDERSESLLKGFGIGEEGLTEVVRSNQLPAYGQGQRGCIGCHTSTPDGLNVGVTWDQETSFSVDIASIEKGKPPGQPPAFVTQAARTALASSSGMFSSFSPAFWSPTTRVMLTDVRQDLVWIDLAAATTATGTLGRIGDPNPRRMGPSWSRTGNVIAYMSGVLADNPFDMVGPADVYTMPFAGGAGATPGAPARPLAGASSPGRAEYYPAISPDEAWVAFNAIPDNGRLYDNPSSEIHITPTSGGGSYRLGANDPPACAGKPSPGITNSWPKWAPQVKEDRGRRFYWVVFSSRRNLASDRPQLHVAPIVVDATGAVFTYRALYLWNQEAEADWRAWGNHTPSWDVFVLPPATPK